MICVVGLGFIGLTTALGFSHYGKGVYGYDADPSLLSQIKKGRVPFHEPNLEEQLNKLLGKKFHPLNSLKECIDQSEIIFYCVGTPCNDDGFIDLTPLKKAIGETLDNIPSGMRKILVIRSTVVPNTIKQVLAPFIEERGFELGKDVILVANPEFLREGSAWADFTGPDRIVIGTSDEEGASYLEKLYSTFPAPIHKVSSNTAEFIKYLSNTMLATMISFSNEQRMLAEKIGEIDVSKAFKILHQDRRWFGNPANMASYLLPGCGFGGYCLPKDTQALCSLAREQKMPMKLLEEVLKLNVSIKRYAAEQIAQKASRESYVGILGLSFKPNTDDIRDTPAKEIIQHLLSLGVSKIIAYDPWAGEKFQNAYSLPIEIATSAQEVIKKSSINVILTAWPEFAELKAELNQKTLMDFRYLFV